MLIPVGLPVGVGDFWLGAPGPVAAVEVAVAETRGPPTPPGGLPTAEVEPLGGPARFQAQRTARLRAMGTPKQAAAWGRGARWAVERGIWAVVAVRGQGGQPEVVGAVGGAAAEERWVQQLALQPAAALVTAAAIASPKDYLHTRHVLHCTGSAALSAG